mmetsp:Transcript_2331/g.3345  ORF Transcript_2331/g.3345 Transcript_2331/m.3345 type:complete len:215 (-) Transcript_2331:234-878(-)
MAASPNGKGLNNIARLSDPNDQELEVKKQLEIEDERFDEIKEIFAMFDKDRTGKIQAQDLGFVLRGLGFNVTEEEITKVVNEHDRNGDGTIDLPEFLLMLKNHEFRGPELLQKDVISHFAVFDRKKDGYIDEMDFIEILTQMEEIFTKEDVDALWKEVKVDGDKRINYVEFVEHMFETSLPPIGLSPWIDDEEKYAHLSAHKHKPSNMLLGKQR